MRKTPAAPGAIGNRSSVNATFVPSTPGRSVHAAGVLADGARTVAFSYIGTDITWPIYWHGALGRAKVDLDQTAQRLDARLRKTGGTANVAVLKSVVTQASSAIPVMPLYISIVFKVMKELGLHEGTIEQLDRLFRDRMYRTDGAPAATDDENRLCAASRVTRGFMKMWRSGCAMKPNTVWSGQVSTQVWRRGSAASVSTKPSNLFFGPSLSYRNAWSPRANRSAPPRGFTASRSAIFSKEKSRFVLPSMRTARSAISRYSPAPVKRRSSVRPSSASHRSCARHLYERSSST